jgi:DHA2 family multidrug resistance protein-like MFS transporter
MNASSRVTTAHYHGDNTLILGIVLAVITFWLFAQTTLNVAPAMRRDLQIAGNVSDLAVSITALFSGIFIVVAGGLADQFGRMKFTNLGLFLSILGSLLIAISPAGTATFLMIGRVVQGISAACIMPATLALMKAYFDGPERQRALSFWSIGSWGGSGLSALFGGFVASTLGWRWIFWMSIAVAILSLLLLRRTPESRAESTTRKSFDWSGLTAFIVTMVALNIVVGQGATLGWSSPPVILLFVVFLVSLGAFFKIETGNANGFVDLGLFRNRTFSGATLSNCLLNGAAGTLLVVLTLVQEAAGLSSLQSGLLTIGYLAGVLVTIRIGEKMLQTMGYRKPMLLGCSVTGVGILLTALTFLLARQYLVVAFVGFTLFGIGLGLYATPSTDAAVSNVPQENAGSASGIYKMASSLGAAFGVALSAAIFAGFSRVEGFGPFAQIALGRTDNLDVRFGASIALMFNVLMVVVAIVSISMTIPHVDGHEPAAN